MLSIKMTNIARRARSEVTTAEAKRDLSSLLKRVQAGECITITRYGEPVAVLHPAKMPARSHERLRSEHGQSTVDPLAELIAMRGETRS
jgi:prevent-host-death family protein